MTQNTSKDKLYSLNDLFAGIDGAESVTWENEKRSISHRIRNDIYERLVEMNKDKNVIEDKFIDYCNALKSLLVIYNFGNLLSREDFSSNNNTPISIKGDGNEFFIDLEGNEKRIETDRELILAGISKIVAHVKNGTGYDLTPYLVADDCLEIFKRDGNDSSQVVPVTFSATTVFTTLVYFRRLMKRNNFFTKEEVDKRGGLLDDVVAVVADVMELFYNYANPADDRYDKFIGWGFTLDRTRSEAVTLNDTYAVVDAISRFADAFMQDGFKRDDEFLSLIDSYVAKKHGQQLSFMTDQCVSSIYKTALNVYERTKEVYGKSVFYSSSVREGGRIKYVYTPTVYEQISSSNRSSALFNPLYIAMITMYGYNEKELVIRRFMDDAKLANQFYTEYELKAEEKGLLRLSDFAKTLDSYSKPLRDEETGEETMYDFAADVRWLLDSKEQQSRNYGNAMWRTYYRAARVFQKYIETQDHDRLMEFEEYRDYLNATKDTIDQVQVMYRKFDDAQRLGIVDTDYLMFSPLEFSVDSIGISKLNKANLAVNYLRPMLLSSKIMIVNALTKYPLSDMKTLYNSVKNKRHIKVAKRKNGNLKEIEWLWNEDNVDMNSTARHCEAIAYDYFDYYDKYELGFAAIRNLKKELDAVKFEAGINKEDGSLNLATERRRESRADLKQLVLELTGQNVELIKGVYRQNLSEKDLVIERLQNEKKELAEAYEQKLRDLAAAHEQDLLAKDLAAKEARDKNRISLEMGDNLRLWIREELERYIKRLSAAAVLNILNGNRTSGVFDFRALYSKRDNLIDANFDAVREMWNGILKDIDADPEQANEKISSYNEEFKKAISLQELLSAAFGCKLENEYYWDKLARNTEYDLQKKNALIKSKYNEEKRSGKLNEDKIQD